MERDKGLSGAPVSEDLKEVEGLSESRRRFVSGLLGLR